MNRKLTCIHFAKFLLTRKGYTVFTPAEQCGYDLLIEHMNHPLEYLKVLVLSVSEQQPIVPLKTTSKGKAALRDFDALLCIHPETLATWQLPAKDVPDKDSLYLSARYDCYKVSFISLEAIVKSTPVLLENAKAEKRKDVEELERMQHEQEEVSYDDVDNLLS